MKIQDIIKKESPETVVAVSGRIHRNYKVEYSQKVKKVNIPLDNIAVTILSSQTFKTNI